MKHRFHCRPSLYCSVLVGLFLVSAHTPWAATFYISPRGSNSHSGRSTAPWKTFEFAIPTLRPGDTFILMDGIYNNRTTGYPLIDCSVNATNGTSAHPITIKAENERKAFLQGDGSVTPFVMRNCSHWHIEGLRVRGGDSADGSQDIFRVSRSHNITMRRLLGTRNNRYKNSNIFGVSHSRDIVIEESEAYSFHRYAFIAFQSSFVIFRRNYANSRGYQDIDGGYPSHLSLRGDAGFILYLSDDSIVENCISEGNEAIRSMGSRNRFFGNITINDQHGFMAGHPTIHDYPSTDNYAKNNVSLNAVRRGFHLRSPGIIMTNSTSIGSNGHGLSANNIEDIRHAGGGQWNINPKLIVRNSLFYNNKGTGIIVAHKEDFNPLLLDHINAYGNFKDYGVGTDTRTHSISLDPQLGSCIVYIPLNSPMKRAGKNGVDIGANVIFRYQEGYLTNQKLWDQRTGQFPCGAIVPRVNDDDTFPNSSCVNVHKRLNVGVNGCDIP